MRTREQTMGTGGWRATGLRTAALGLLILALPEPVPAQTPEPGDLVVVANQGARTVVVADARTGERLLELDGLDGPHEVAVSDDGRTAVVSDYGNQTVLGRSLHVLDLETLTRRSVIDLGEHRRPHDLIFLPDGMLAVTSETSRAVLLVDVEEGRVVRVLPTGAAGSHMLAASGDGSRIFTANLLDGSVSEIDMASGDLRRVVPVAPRDEGIAVSADGSRIWVTSLEEQNVRVLDGASMEVLATLPAPGHPYRVTLSPDGTRAFVPGPAADVVRIFDTRTLEETTVPVPGGPGKVTVGPDGRTAYLPLNGAGKVAVLDLETLQVVRELDTGAGPDGLGVSGLRARRGPAAAREDPHPVADPQDVATVDAIIAALYDAISGPIGEARDWDRLRSLFLPSARMIPVQRAPDGSPGYRTLTVDEYIRSSGPVIERDGFREREVARLEDGFGPVVHAFSTYEGFRRDQEQPFLRGVNSIQLIHDGSRWWVSSIAWSPERPDLPLPERFRGDGG